MRVPLSWLRDFAPIENPPEEVAATLDRLGLVVEGVEHVGADLDGVVVARVDRIDAIPGADKIRAVTVDVAGEPVDVVCGAWNFAEGDLVPLATVGTVLPGWDVPIARRKMRGVTSNGMLCSPQELGLAEDHSGILVLPAGLSTGTPLKQALGLEADVVFDLDITPNRPDAMSIIGVARDLAAGLGLPFAIPDVATAESGAPASDLATVVNEAPELCPTFLARVVAVPAGLTTPEHVARRLTLAGMRPIHPVVDASNYVMLETGQPSHPYDLDRLAGRGLRVRAARPGETLITLDGVERTLGTGPFPDCVICDAEDRPVGIAGVMGGEGTGISESTASVLLEVAYFTPMAVARTSKRLGLRTEASARFERGCDPEGVRRAADRICALLPGAVVAPGWLGAANPPPPRRLTLRTERVNRLLGVSLPGGRIRALLEPIGFAASGGPESFEVEVPGWRPDVTAEVDLVEEVGRHHGYESIARTVPTTAQVGGLSPYQAERRLLRHVLAGAGLTEVWTPSLLGALDHAEIGVAGGQVELINPMTAEEAALRRTTLVGVLRALRFNASHRNTGLRVFEVGRVFDPPPAGSALPAEREVVSAALAGDGDDAASAVRLWRTIISTLRLADADLSPADGPGLHPGRTAAAVVGGRPVGLVGEVDPDVVAAFDLTGRIGWLELDLGVLLDSARLPEAARPVSVFPSSDFDLAFVVDDAVAAGAVAATLRRAAGDLLEDLALFDVYRDTAHMGEGRRSLAFRLRVGAHDRTLTDPEIADVRRRAIEAVVSEHGAALRG